MFDKLSIPSITKRRIFFVEGTSSHEIRYDSTNDYDIYYINHPLLFKDYILLHQDTLIYIFDSFNLYVSIISQFKGKVVTVIKPSLFYTSLESILTQQLLRYLNLRYQGCLISTNSLDIDFILSNHTPNPIFSLTLSPFISLPSTYDSVNKISLLATSSVYKSDYLLYNTEDFDKLDKILDEYESTTDIGPVLNRFILNFSVKKNHIPSLMTFNDMLLKARDSDDRADVTI